MEGCRRNACIEHEGTRHADTKRNWRLQNGQTEGARQMEYVYF